MASRIVETERSLSEGDESIATLSYSNCPVANGLLTALSAGFLQDAGIRLQVLSGQQGAVHFTYDQPAYTRFGGEIPPLVSEALRAPGRTRLLGITPLRAHQGYYVLAQSPIRSASDLKGRRVGVSDAARRILQRELGDYLQLDPWRQTLIALGTWEARALLHTLEAGNLRLNDVELVRIESPGVDVPKERLNAASSLKGADLFLNVAQHQAAILEQGKADAIFAWLPWAAELEERIGARPIVELDRDIRNAYASVWTVSSQLLEEQPEVVQRLVDAVVDAGRWAVGHGEQVTRLHAENLGVSETAIRLGFGSDFHRHLVPRLDEDALGILERTQKFLLEHALIPKPVHLNHWIAPEFLNRSITRSFESII